MATPYLQIKVDEAPSTQDLARAEMEDLPVVVIAQRQSEGRGRSGDDWWTAPRALAVSVAMSLPGDDRPISLMAGVAAIRAIEGVTLKWPNDLLVGPDKVGGILVEQSGDVVVVGLGVNLWWPEATAGVGAIYADDPGEERHAEIGAVWAAEMMRLIEAPAWPIGEYRSACMTLGRTITWEPGGEGVAQDVEIDGSLTVDVGGRLVRVRSGSVSHVRP